MRWDLGIQGVAVLMGMSLGFGVLAQLLLWSRGMRGAWWVGSVAFFAMGLLISEVLFGWATQEELQPNIDGLSFDEVLLGYLVGIPVVLLVRYLVRSKSVLPMKR